LTLLLFTLAAIFIWMAHWQYQRMQEKQVLNEQFTHARRLSIQDALAAEHRWSRVEASGKYDTGRHVLLDNQVLNGRVGVFALTPFRLADGAWLLVNRGWLPLPPDRSRLPGVPTTQGSLNISGILNFPPQGGPRLGEPDRLSAENWPQLVTYLDLDEVSRAIGHDLLPWIIQLDGEDATGFDGRNWRPFAMGPDRHGAYALQWLSLAVTAIVIWLVLGVRRAAAGRRPQA
jgi:surfeit locus 1 family protein